MDATLLLRHWAWKGRGGILIFMNLAYTRGGYVSATSLGMGGVGGNINVYVPCVDTWMLRCCYVTGHGWGGGNINIHVSCAHTCMLRCCYVTGHGWERGGNMNLLALGCAAAGRNLSGQLSTCVFGVRDM